jgi:nitrous oxide reductase accessory protein NosL
MKRVLAAILLAACLITGLAGCAATEDTATARPGVSTIPWNRPAKWEGGGVLGGQMSAMRGY